MAQKIGFPGGFANDEELRSMNRKVVEDYMGRQGEERLTRYLLFTEDGCGGGYGQLIQQKAAKG